MQQFDNKKNFENYLKGKLATVKLHFHLLSFMISSSSTDVSVVFSNMGGGGFQILEKMVSSQISRWKDLWKEKDGDRIYIYYMIYNFIHILNKLSPL